MSIDVMSAVWRLKDLADSEMLILLAMADWADKDGVCWPSVAQLADKTNKSERTIQGAIKAIVDKGHLTRTENRGRGCMYVVHPRSGCTPAVAAPRKDRTPAAAAPPQGTTDTPAAVAPNTLVHIIPQRATPSSVRAKVSPKRFRIPEDWKPIRFADDTVAREIVDRRGVEWARSALESFRNWAANADDRVGRKSDWQKAWINWIIEQDKRDGRRTHQPDLRQGLRGSRPDPSLDMLRAAQQAQSGGSSGDRGDHRESRVALQAYWNG